jgi:hypothetical protein
LRAGTERTLIPPDNSGHYSLPLLYGDSVIFWRNQLLWRIDVNGTIAARLIPGPSETQ